MAPDRQPEPIARAVVANKPKTRVRGDGSIRPVGAVEGELEPMPSPVPEEPKIKLVASERMRLSYDIAGAGPAGVGRVYLYFTRDGGKTWELCCEDADLQSPIEAELPGEGAYGLSIIVVNKAETGRHKPAPGELPQMLVHVDKTKPVALLKKPTPNPESPRDELVLSWESSDEHPTDKAVDLYYTPDPDVGWHKIARNLPASGKHAWRIPDGVPHLVFFRLVARDQCGNEERITTERPISIDLSNPQAKLGSVIDVLPAPKNDD
ncbi:MAG TPA: hypothetical protein VNC50_16105 [Planctomycetia bacterium]|nr:hypothetical protein [Planctomycetia bacterium]